MRDSVIYVKRGASLICKGARAHRRSAVPMPVAMEVEPLATWMGIVSGLRNVKSMGERML